MKTWRTQIHFLADVRDGQVLFEVPAWDQEDVVVRQLDTLPPEIQERVREGYRCHARVNLDAERHSSLTFTDWEIS